MPVFDSSGNLKVVGDRAGNIAVYDSAGTLVSSTAEFIQFSGSAVSGVTSVTSGVLVNLVAGTSSGSTSSGSSTFTKGLAIVDPLVTKTFVAWRSDGDHVLTGIRGIFSGNLGSSASFQAAKNGSSLHLSATMHLNSNDTWFNGGGIANGVYSAGDYLQVRLVGLSGTVDYATIQADFSS